MGTLQIQNITNTQGISYIKLTPIIPKNLIYTLEFQTQHIYPANLPLTTIPFENLIYTIKFRTIMAFLCERVIPNGREWSLNLKYKLS